MTIGCVWGFVRTCSNHLSTEVRKRVREHDRIEIVAELTSAVTESSKGDDRGSIRVYIGKEGEGSGHGDTGNS